MRMWLLCKIVSTIAVTLCSLQLLSAQDLAPRAYNLTPLHANAVTVTYGFYDGALLFNGVVPISNAKGKYNVPVLSYYHSFKMFGHFANITASLPYAVGHFNGDFEKYRKGFTVPDFSTRRTDWPST